jgi:hypothetical protein
MKNLEGTKAQRGAASVVVRNKEKKKSASNKVPKSLPYESCEIVDRHASLGITGEAVSQPSCNSPFSHNGRPYSR